MADFIGTLTLRGMENRMDGQKSGSKIIDYGKFVRWQLFEPFLIGPSLVHERLVLARAVDSDQLSV